MTWSLGTSTRTTELSFGLEPAGEAPGRFEIAEAQVESDRITSQLVGRRQEVRAEVFDEVEREVGTEWREQYNASQLSSAFRSTNPRELAGRDDAVAALTSRAAQSLAGVPASAGVNIPMSPEAFEAEVDRRLAEEYQDAQDILGAAPEGSWKWQLAGSFYAGATDPVNVAMMPLGVGGGLARTVAAESALGVLGEAVSLPAQFDAAERLGIDEPNPAAQLAFAGAIGGALPATVGGLAYGARAAAPYVSSRLGFGTAQAQTLGEDPSRIPPGVSPLAHEDAIDTAQMEMMRGPSGPDPRDYPDLQSRGDTDPPDEDVDGLPYEPDGEGAYVPDPSGQPDLDAAADPGAAPRAPARTAPADLPPASTREAYYFDEQERRWIWNGTPLPRSITRTEDGVWYNRGMGPLFANNGSQSRMTNGAATTRMAEVLQGPYAQLVELFDGPVVINDAIAKAGTSRERQTPGSNHFQGTALDINITFLNDEERLRLFRAARASGFQGFGFGTNILHIDMGNNRSWTYGVNQFGGVPVSQLQREVVSAPIGIEPRARATPAPEPIDVQRALTRAPIPREEVRERLTNWEGVETVGPDGAAEPLLPVGRIFLEYLDDDIPPHVAAAMTGSMFARSPGWRGGPTGQATGFFSMAQRADEYQDWLTSVGGGTEMRTFERATEFWTHSLRTNHPDQWARLQSSTTVTEAVQILEEVQQAYQPQGPAVSDDVLRMRYAVGFIESGNDYGRRGPLMTTGAYAGERAMGRYQIMPGNLPQWSREALGREVTEAEFMASPEIQDAIFDHYFVRDARRLSPEDAMSIWHSGRPLAEARAAGTTDGWTRTADHVAHFNRRFAEYRPEDDPHRGGAAATGPRVAEVVGAGEGWVEVRLDDGTTERRTGNRPTRNNNPGSLDYGDFARSHGAIGSDGRVAVFPTPQAGRAAQEALLFEAQSYRGMTIAQAINRYAPPAENDTNWYISQVSTAAGASPDTRLSDLTPEQRVLFLDEMNRVEGYEGDIAALSRPAATAANVDLGEGPEAYAWRTYALWGSGRVPNRNIINAPVDASAAPGLRIDAFPPGIFTGAERPPVRTGSLTGRGGTGSTGSYSGSGSYYSTGRGFTGSGSVTAGDDLTVDVEYEVVDLSQLSAATGDLQPRDRSRLASDEQIAEIAARLDPARLMPSPEADRGAPVVGPDGIIESGNGRVRAIERAAAQHPDRFDAYRREIKAAGYDVPDDMQTPVLIARRTTDLSPDERRRFVRQANTSAVARMSATERASADASAMSLDTVRSYDASQPLTAAANRPFVRGFLASIPQAERNGLITADGALNIEGIQRIQGALFASAYGDADMIAKAVETGAGELRTLLDAMREAAPAWSALKADIAAGVVRPEMDISPYVLDAMRMIADARLIAKQSGARVANVVDELLAEIDMLDGAVPPLTVALVRKFYPEGRAARSGEVTAFLTRYADEARTVGKADEGLFGAGPGPLEVLKALDPDAFGDLTEIGSRGAGTSPPPQDTPAALAAFDDGAASPVAKAADMDVIESVRAELPGYTRAELALLEVELDDGTKVTMADVMDDLDADADLVAVIEACTTRMG